MVIRNAHQQASTPPENKILKIQAFFFTFDVPGEGWERSRCGAGVRGVVFFSGEVLADSTALKAWEGSAARQGNGPDSG